MEGEPSVDPPSVDILWGLARRGFCVCQVHTDLGHTELGLEIHLEQLVIMFYQCACNTKTISECLDTYGICTYGNRTSSSYSAVLIMFYQRVCSTKTLSKCNITNTRISKSNPRSVEQIVVLVQVHWSYFSLKIWYLNNCWYWEHF